MIATIPSATLLGVDGRPVSVEVHVSNGLPGFNVVGHPDTSCREARDRVRAALLSSGLPWSQKKVTVNLAPSGFRKGGAGLDVAMAVGLLVASDLLAADLVADMAFLGELGLDGSLRGVAGMVPLVDAIGAATVVVPVASVEEAALVGRHKVRAAANLRQLVEALRGDEPWPDVPGPGAGDRARRDSYPRHPDLADVRG
ncbi:MAG: magnesium chelatase domain-containing protein, partial [Acidimicrobiales bacterium]